MYAYKRILVGLDFTEMDTVLIRYTAFLAYYLRPDKLYFLHIQPDLGLPLPQGQDWPELPTDEAIQAKMESAVQAQFPDYKDYPVEFKVVEGSPRKEIMRWTQIKEIDLLIVGRKQVMNGSGVVPRQLARSLNVSILFVPEGVTCRLRRLLVANDFSLFSRMAMEEALALASEDADIELISQYVYTVPMAYYKMGKTEGQFAQLLEHHGKESYREWARDLKLNGQENLSAIFTWDREKAGIHKTLHETAKEKEVDLILLGARGRTATTAFLLGSVAEKLIEQNATIPMLLVKRKDHAYDFGEWLESI